MQGVHKEKGRGSEEEGGLVCMRFMTLCNQLIEIGWCVYECMYTSEA